MYPDVRRYSVLRAVNAPYEQNDLQKVSLPIVPLSQCLAAYGSNMLVSDINICAGDVKVGGIDACLGDSGGPLMCYQNGAYFLYGTVSFGKGCAEPGFPGVYANIANPEINAWIRSNL
ncbi:hypothetical protein C0Q70_18511 [Pomacea canaliculata]|uniref:Peptidase S1 domain-containing protein n=1 Tax=Pomacea canaliculata TaxID=400727 RepID=A0A2T7NGQ1_POMCA|nr:hypothetical protein C0Q70_18511 [Pomacea canaliculata]